MVSVAVIWEELAAKLETTMPEGVGSKSTPVTPSSPDPLITTETDVPTSPLSGLMLATPKPPLPPPPPEALTWKMAGAGKPWPPEIKTIV